MKKHFLVFITFANLLTSCVFYDINKKEITRNDPINYDVSILKLKYPSIANKESFDSIRGEFLVSESILLTGADYNFPRQKKVFLFEENKGYVWLHNSVGKIDLINYYHDSIKIDTLKVIPNSFFQKNTWYVLLAKRGLVSDGYYEIYFYFDNKFRMRKYRRVARSRHVSAYGN